MRRIEPDDRDAVQGAFARLSEQSRYQRFMSAINELSESQLRYLTEVDHHDHEALIAFDREGGLGVGVGRYVRLDDGTSAEAAVTVVDEWQGRGLGTALCPPGAGRSGTRRYQPRVSSNCSGASSAVEMPTIGSPRPAETRARISASL